jgi:hypothetical protein
MCINYKVFEHYHHQTLIPFFLYPVFFSFRVCFEESKWLWVSQAKLYISSSFNSRKERGISKDCKVFDTLSLTNLFILYNQKKEKKKGKGI